jgi:tetratricopeptide (TPR) repeat protein
MGGTALQDVRKLQGYSVNEVIRLLLGRAETLNIPVMSATSLKTKISRWENGHERVSEPYRRLFRDIYGRTNEELGFPPEVEDEETGELLARLAVARTLDGATVEIFRQQINNARHIDRRYGAITVLDQLRATIKQIESLLGYSTTRGHRELLAGILTEASALAGWEALDRNAIRQAWDHHERAKAAALEASSPTLYAHSCAQQAFILIDLGETAAAVGQLADARDCAERSTPALLRAWLAAAHGEGLAAAGERDHALRAFDTAAALLPTDPEDPNSPSSSSPEPTSTAGAATPSPASANATQSNASPTPYPAYPPPSSAPEPQCSWISPTPTPQPATETPPCTTPGKPNNSHPRSNPTANYAGSPPSSSHPGLPTPRETANKRQQ